ncbi:MAG TPA: oxygenase MpaB family protein [Capillimicrobium sp.]|nr:oxygenase MpaB family protein [Capillimicrobium sp.]
MPSLFDDRSMLRRVHRESAVALAGPRTLLLQATHPVAFAGFFSHTGALDEPYQRLERTAQVMDTIAFGEAAAAERATRIVRAMHHRVHGVLDEPAGRFPAGTPYRADDPALLLWILACLVNSALVVYDRYVGTLSRDEREAYWQDQRVVGSLFGLADEHMPPTIADFDAYWHDMLTGDVLHVGEEARELAIEIVLRPPVPLKLRPVVELVNQITVGLLPRRVRRMYGLRWDPVRGLAVRTGAEYVKRAVVPVLPERVRLVRSARAA